MQEYSVEINNLTRREINLRELTILYSAVAKKVLPKWEISLVFVGPKKAVELNKKLRNKTYIPNVLSYAIGEKSGEIFICLNEAEKQAPLHNLNYDNFVLFLFIHGLLHLNGMAHGVIMERWEKKILKQFSASADLKSASNYGKAHNNRN